MPRNLEIRIVSRILKSLNTIFQTENAITYKFLGLSKPQRQQLTMPCHAVVKHHHRIRPVKPEMEDTFLDNNRISCLMSDRKNGIIICFLQKTLWN